MNEQLPTCESLAETISLLAAGCLTPEEEIEVRQHLANCSTCRERFDQLDSVCGDLHAARREEWFSAAETAVTRAMAQISVQFSVFSVQQERTEELPALSGGLGAFKSRSHSRWPLIVVAGIAASILAIVGWRSLSIVPSRSPDVAHRNPPKEIPAPAKETTTVAKTIVASSRPTWRALQRAAARSEEAFDDLLTRGNETVGFPPLNKRSLLQETDL